VHQTVEALSEKIRPSKAFVLNLAIHIASWIRGPGAKLTARNTYLSPRAFSELRSGTVHKLRRILAVRA